MTANFRSNRFTSGFNQISDKGRGGSLYLRLEFVVPFFKRFHRRQHGRRSVQNIGWGRGQPWRTREREPICESGGFAPSGVQGQRPWSDGMEGETPQKLNGF